MTRLLVKTSLMILLGSTLLAPQQSSAQSSDVIGNRRASKMSVMNVPTAAPAEKLSKNRSVKNAAVEQNPIYITVIGQVAQPGVYEFPNHHPNLEQLISQHAGGLTPYSRKEFFVFREGHSMMQLFHERHSLFQFEDGDILLAETPAKYYEAMGQGVSGPSLYDLHPQTQIVLVNVIDRPVLFSVNPKDARLVRLLEVLQQDASAMVGINPPIEPPHAKYIPANAGITPNTIISGSILKFDPRAIKRHTLPDLPQAIRIVISDKVKVASNELTVPSIEHPSPIEKSFSTQGAKRDTWSLPSVSTEDPVEVPGDNKKSEDKKSFKSKGTPFHDAFHVFDENGSMGPSDNEPVRAAKKQDKNQAGNVLSSQQTAYFVSFLIIISLFGTAWFIRQRQSQKGAKRFFSAESRYQSYATQTLSMPLSMDSQDIPDASDTVAEEVAEETVESVEGASADAEVQQLSSPAEADVPTQSSEEEVEEKKVTRDELVDSDVIEPVGNSAVAEDDLSEPLPQITLEELLAETVEFADSQSVDEPSGQTNTDERVGRQRPLFVPESIMDNPLMRELLKEQASDYLQKTSQNHDAASSREKAELPVSKEPFIEPKPASKKTFRLDQAHGNAPQPLFPIVWQHQADVKNEDAKINRYQSSDVSPEGSSTDRVDSETSAVSGPHMKMQDPAQPRDEEEAELFDRVFRAVMRERQKNQS